MKEEDILLFERLAISTDIKYSDNPDVHILAKSLITACHELRRTLKKDSGKEYRAVFFRHEPESQRELRLEKLKAFLKYNRISEGDVKRSGYYQSIEDLFEDMEDCETEEQFDEAIRFYIELNKRDFDYYKRRDVVSVEKRIYREKLARSAGTHSEREWMILCALCRFACARCGSKDKLTKDHVIPLYHEGQSSDSISNIQPLCFSCNCAKGGDTTDYVAPSIRESMARGIF